MTRTVHLHIGEPKTGTTYLQGMLFHHQNQLRDAGILVPGKNLDHIRAGHDVLGRTKTAGTHSTEGAWEELAGQIESSELPHAVISMEMLTRAGAPQAARAVRAFSDSTDVRVVVTARELSRLVPARWQESVQFRKSWTLDEYVAGVFDSPRERDTGPAKHFWGLHDTPVTVQTWGKHVSPDHISVVTVPPSGSAPDLLWTRFGDAIGADLRGYAPADTSNASLGAASAELMRRLNDALADSDMGDADHARICRRFLGKSVLPELKSQEPGIALPPAFSADAHALSVQIVTELRHTGARVVGNLDELLSSATSTEPLAPTEAQIASAAVAAMAALVEQNAKLARKARRRGDDLPFTEVD
ncbi:MAG: hypothetical protein ACJ74E_06245 [Actinomycetes bacterium]